MKYLLLLIFLAGCSIEGATPTVIKVELTDEAHALLAKPVTVKLVMDEPVKIDSRYIYISQIYTEEQQDALLKDIVSLDPRVTVKDVVQMFERHARVSYRDVIERNRGPIGGPIHPFTKGDLNNDRVVDGKDMGMWKDFVLTDKTPEEDKDRLILKDLEE